MIISCAVAVCQVVRKSLVFFPGRGIIESAMGQFIPPVEPIIDTPPPPRYIMDRATTTDRVISAVEATYKGLPKHKTWIWTSKPVGPINRQSNWTVEEYERRNFLHQISPHIREINADCREIVKMLREMVAHSKNKSG